MTGVGRHHTKAFLLLHAPQAQFAAHAFDRPETRPKAIGGEFTLQASCTISGAGSVMRRLCRHLQASFGCRPPRRLPHTPGVVAARGNIKHAAEHCERNSAFSRRSRDNSASASVTMRRPATAPAALAGSRPSLAHLTQFARVFKDIDKRRAASAMLRPSRVTSKTACARNSLV